MNINLFYLLITLFFASPTFAEIFNAFPKTDLQFAMLPPYCEARMRHENDLKGQLWRKKLGPDFVHVHHYCAALNALNEAYKTSYKEDTRGMLSRAIKEIEYMEHQTSSNFILRPKIAYDKGTAYEGLKDYPNAISQYQQSIKYNPKLTPAYVALSDLYLKLNKKKEAMEILKQGLKFKPDSKALKKRLAKFSK